MSNNIGFKMTQNENVLFTRNPRDFILWSKYPPLKIIKYGQTVLNIPSGTNNYSKGIPHGLGYAPAHLTYYDIDNNGKFWLADMYLGTLASSEVSDRGIGSASFGESYADKYELVLASASSTFGGEPAYNIPVRYILFDQPTFDSPGGNDKPIGYQKANVGFKVSKGDKNIFDAKLYEQSVNSNNDFLKYHATKTGQINFNNTSNGSSSKEIIHGLGYYPLFMVYGHFSNNIQEHAFPIGRVPSPFASGAYATTNGIKIVIVWAGSPFPADISFNFRVVIFKNSMLGDQ